MNILFTILKTPFDLKKNIKIYRLSKTITTRIIYNKGFQSGFFAMNEFDYQ